MQCPLVARAIEEPYSIRPFEFGSATAGLRQFHPRIGNREALELVPHPS
jgi:hypothetical protein